MEQPLILTATAAKIKSVPSLASQGESCGWRSLLLSLRTLGASAAGNIVAFVLATQCEAPAHAMHVQRLVSPSLDNDKQSVCSILKHAGTKSHS